MISEDALHNPKALNVPPALFSINSTHEYLGGVTRSAVYDLINLRKIKIVKLGSRALVVRSSLDDYIASIACL
jgi:excisionase family DNA binding protein